jgi:hypothetical protein
MHSPGLVEKSNKLRFVSSCRASSVVNSVSSAQWRAALCQSHVAVRYQVLTAASKLSTYYAMWSGWSWQTSHRPDDGCSEHLWNVGQLVRHHGTTWHKAAICICHSLKISLEGPIRMLIKLFHPSVDTRSAMTGVEAKVTCSSSELDGGNETSPRSGHLYSTILIEQEVLRSQNSSGHYGEWMCLNCVSTAAVIRWCEIIRLLIGLSDVASSSDGGVW